MTHLSEFYAGGIAVQSYDLFIGANGALRGDIQFYRGCAQRFGTDVFELAVGTGRVAIPLAEAGCTVTGLDKSQAMLDLAARKIAGLSPHIAARIRLHRGDMQDFDLGRQFRLILVPARAFQHLVEPAMQQEGLRCMHRHLEPRGHLVLDLFDPRLEYCLPDAPLPGASLEVQDPATGHRIRRTVVARDNDPFRQTVSEKLRFEILAPEGHVLATEETFWSLRWTLRQEMIYLLERCGFQPIEQFSDFQGSPPGYGREQLWIARAI